MPSKRTTDCCCPNPDCPFAGKRAAGNIVLHSSFKLKRGRRRRYRCTACARTFCSTTTTPYHRIQYSKNLFDEVVAMSVEGVSKSAIARIKGISWNTVARWLERAAAAARRFNDAMTQGFSLDELQLDEIRTFAPRKSEVCWVFTSIEVRSRLWPSTVVGRRSYRNTEKLLRETIHRGEFATPFLITTDGFKYYKRVVQQLLGPACLYGQVQKMWRNNRVIKVERAPILCSDWRLKDALLDSEDSSTLNTSFIERLQLTIRQGSSYLGRRSSGTSSSPSQNFSSEARL